MSNLVITVATAAGAVLTALGGGSLVSALARRRPTRVEAVVNLNESTFEWAERIEASRIAERDAYAADRAQFRADIAEARQEAKEARDENVATNRIARALRIELSRAQDEVGEMRRELDRLSEIVAAIRDPEMTLDRLRIMVDKQSRR
jgi:predicted  nucleic acid-binding Zn-ribbon protein